MNDQAAEADVIMGSARKGLRRVDMRREYHIVDIILGHHLAQEPVDARIRVASPLEAVAPVDAIATRVRALHEEERLLALLLCSTITPS